MKMKILKIWVFLASLLLLGPDVLAAPTFQVYIDGATGGTIGEDEDSWFTYDNSFQLIAVGAYKPQTTNLTQATLALSVPQGEVGTISITGSDDVSLLTTQQAVPQTTYSYYNPNADADTDLLTDVSGNDGYLTKNFLPDAQRLQSNHYPFQDGVSDFLIYGIDDFEDIDSIHNYNAEDGTITADEGYGEEKVFDVQISGFSRVHFDLYGYEVTEDGATELVGTWSDNPNSHDSTYIIPAPGAILLAGIGVTLVGWLRRRRSL